MIISRQGTISDIQGVLKLQKANLYSELTEEERLDGFVTTPFTFEQIEQIIMLNGLFVSELNSEIIAYIYAGPWSYFEQWEIFPYMTSRFPKLSYNGHKLTIETTFQYGPVCIEKNQRGKKLFNHLFEEMRLVFLKTYPISVTFINKINTISTCAHSKLGWEVIDEFHFNGNTYLGLAFDMKQSVL